MIGDGAVPSKLGLQWIAIAEHLGLRVVAPASILLPSGERIDADALLPDFGARRGMLLVTDDEAVWAHRAAIDGAGYGFSVLSDPGSSIGSPPPWEEAIHLLRDWGWSGSPKDEPAWMRSP